MTGRETIRASVGLLDRRDRRLLALAILIQIATSVLDLIGVALIGVVGVLAVSLGSGEPPPKAILRGASIAGLGGLSEYARIAVLAAVAAVVLLAKSGVSPILMNRTLSFLARREARVSARLAGELFSRPLSLVQRRSTQKTAATLISGTNAAVSVVLGQFVVFCSEIALLAMLAVTLLLVNAAVALAAIAFFAVVAVALQGLLGRRATRLAAERRRADVASATAIQEGVGAYREITVSDRRLLYVDRIQGLRGESARSAAGSQLIAMLPKYFSEAALVVGAFSLAGVLFTTRPPVMAAGTFALFLATATRVMPSLLRVQSAGLSIRSAAGTAAPVFDLVRDLGFPPDISKPVDGGWPAQWVVDRNHPGLVPTIELRDVTFAYPGSHTTAVMGISVDIGAGVSMALAGRSGAGKSTLADLILGVLQPQTGQVLVGDMPPGEAVRRWPGGISYVPQDILLSNDSIRANVALGLPRDLVDDDQVWDALRRAHLDEYVRSLPEGLDTQIGERGLRLSGGQRQRVGIARALFTQPRLLVLDEATSSLDTETEQAITQMLEALDADVTTVIIAHRLSTIRHVDRVVYLEDGRIIAQGTFNDVCVQIPALQRQAAAGGHG